MSGEDAAVDSNPMAKYLKDIVELNQLCCSILDAGGYSGAMLRVDLPAQQEAHRKSKITAPRSLERQLAIEKAKTQGALFLKTGGAALNDDDFLIAAERKVLRQELKDLEKKKKQHKASSVRHTAAMAIIESEQLRTAEGVAKLSTQELKDLIAWKLVGKALLADTE